MADESQYVTCFNFLEEVFIASAGKSTAQLRDFFDSINEINTQVIREIQNSNTTDPAEIRKIVYRYQQSKIDKFLDFYSNKDNPFPHIDIQELIQKAAEFISSFPISLRQEQAPERFHAQPGNSEFIKFFKVFKRWFFNVSVIPRRVGNGTLRLVGKKPKPIRYWRYTIPAQEIAGYVVNQCILERMSAELDDFNRQCIRISKAVLERDQQLNRALLSLYSQSKQDFNFKERIPAETFELDGLLEKFISDTKNIATDSDKQITELSAVVSTIDYPAWRLRWKNRKNNTASIRLSLENQLKNWGNTAFALIEDWKIDQEIYWLKVKVEMSVLELNDSLLEKHAAILEQLKVVSAKIGQRKKEIYELLVNEKQDYVSLQIEAQNSLKTGITRQNLIQAVEQLVSYNLPAKINDFELYLVNQINQLYEKRWLTQKTDYARPLKQSELSSFSLRELVESGCFPLLAEQCASLKIKTVSEIERLRFEILNIENVLAFNLSALSQHEESEFVNKDDIPDLFNEGMDRSISKLEYIASEVGNFGNNTAGSIKKITDDFNTTTLALTENESAFELRMIIMKAKALKKTEEFGIRTWNYSKDKYFILLRTAKKVIADLNTFITPWRRKIGLGTTESGISSELSDFLSEANKRINNLPVIYQRLYRIQPLTEMSFFVGREKEIEQLSHAFKSHQESKFAPTVIVGEKWCGHTTLINYFTTKHLDKTQIISGALTRNISTTAEFYDFWMNLLKKDNIESLDDLIQIIQTEQNGKTIILENIHNFYLRTINGFDNLNLFIRLVTHTYTNVFWLFSANKYAWEYLTKTKELAGYFGYVIEMTPYNDDELRELIIRKNSVSGYRIKFLQSEINSSDKKFLALDEKDQQAYLRDEFFKDLNYYAKGNISLCLSFWLLSTGKITENTIEIVKFKPPDLSFVKHLNAEKVFILFLLIMHDGLTIEQLCQIYRKPIHSVQLLVIMLLDDGVLIERSGWYEVNPLIYRLTIEVLKSRNLIN